MDFTDLEKTRVFLSEDSGPTSKKVSKTGDAAREQITTNCQKLDQVFERTIDNDPFFQDNLTTKEQRVLKHVLKGMTNKQIALSIGKVQRTVEYHRNSIMKKLNVRNIADLFKIIVVRSFKTTHQNNPAQKPTHPELFP